MVKDTWRTVAARKKADQAAAIPKEWIIELPALDVLNVTGIPNSCGLLSEKELEITELKDVGALLEKLASGEWSSVEVVKAYYKRAIIAQQLVNCLTEIYIEKALAWAADLDKRLKETGKPVGPLHGLPISLKDQICIEGMDTTMGYVAWIDKPAKRNSALVDILLDAGAVPFVRTNVPQTLMWGETFNVIYGRTVNPFNKNLTCGGSSGGEGALIAMGGSPLGVGSDIGGSIRNPASMNGLYGLKGSYDRIPYEGAVNSGQGNEGIVSVLGPLSRSFSGLVAFTKTVLESRPWTRDPYCVRKPWDESSYKLAEHGSGSKMCFAILWDDGIVKPTPPVQRALEMAKKALEAAGHEVIDWTPPVKHSELRPMLMQVFGADGGENVIDVCVLSGEPALATMDPKKPPQDAIDQPEGTKVVWRRDGRPDPVPLSAYDYFKILWKKRGLQKDYLDGWMKTRNLTSTGRPVDAIISPVSPYPAPPHGNHVHPFYTAVWNLLDYAAAVFPVTTVDPQLDTPLPPHEFLTDEDKLVHEIYSSAEKFKDAPINLQIVGGRWEEEGVLGMTGVVVEALEKL